MDVDFQIILNPKRTRGKFDEAFWIDFAKMRTFKDEEECNFGVRTEQFILLGNPIDIMRVI